jgi:hypothetical protein
MHSECVAIVNTHHWRLLLATAIWTFCIAAASAWSVHDALCGFERSSSIRTVRITTASRGHHGRVRLWPPGFVAASNRGLRPSTDVMRSALMRLCRGSLLRYPCQKQRTVNELPFLILRLQSRHASRWCAISQCRALDLQCWATQACRWLTRHAPRPVLCVAISCLLARPGYSRMLRLAMLPRGLAPHDTTSSAADIVQDSQPKLAIVMKVMGRTGSRGQVRVLRVAACRPLLLDALCCSWHGQGVSVSPRRAGSRTPYQAAIHTHVTYYRSRKSV